MPVLLSTAISRPDAWSVGAPSKATPSMDMAYIKLDGAPVIIQLAEKSSLGEMTCPWAPNVYRGDGTESRVTMTVNITDRVREGIEAMEELIRDKLRPSIANIDARWHSSTKPADKHPSSVRLKINISGPKACPTFNGDGEPIDMPTDWSGLAVLPIVHVKGAYVQKGMSGLVIDVVSLMVGDKQRREVDTSFI